MCGFFFKALQRLEQEVGKLDIRYQSLRTQAMADMETQSKRNPFSDWFSDLEEYEYRAMYGAEFDLERYRDYMERYNILELSYMFYSRIASMELNG